MRRRSDIEPRFAAPCRCERPQPLRDADDGEVRCVACGRAVTPPAPSGELTSREVTELAKTAAALVRQVAQAVAAANANTGEQVPRLTLRKEEAAVSLGVSVDFLEAHVLPEVRAIRTSRCVMIPVADLERWVDEHAALTLGGNR